jgi:YaiO family outer membrane protein
MLLSLLLTATLAQTPSPTHDDALQLAQSGDYAEALRAFQQIAAANPADHRARLWIAQLHVWMGHPERAEPVYRSVMLEDPNNIDALLGVATTLLARHEADEALEVLQRAEQLEPQNPEVLAGLGRAYRRTGQTTTSLGYLQRTIALAPSETNLLSLEQTRMLHQHQVEISSFLEEFSDLPDGRSGDIRANIRLNERWRLFGRGQYQRKFNRSEQRGGLGATWRWQPATTLSGHFFIGPNNEVLPQRDFLADITHMRGQADWGGTFRYIDFEGAQVAAISPALSYWWSDRLNLGLRYSFVMTDFAALPETIASHSTALRGSYQVIPRVWANVGYAYGIENFDTLSPDRIGEFNAHTGSIGFRVDLRSLTGVYGVYEHQWRPGDTRMHRFTAGIAQRF